MGDLAAFAVIQELAVTEKEVFDAIDLLKGAGIEPHWLYPQSKCPVGKGWPTHSKRSFDDLKKEYRRGYNLGARAGAWSTPAKGKSLIIIDKDVKSTDPRHRQEADQVVRELLGDLDRYPTVQTGWGNGSAQYYALVDEKRIPDSKDYRVSPEKVEVNTKEGLKTKDAWQVSILSTGKQAVAPPSVHPDTGNKYIWVREPAQGIPDLPEGSYSLLMRLQPSSATSTYAADGLQAGELSDIEDALNFIDPGSYDVWLTVGMALKTSSDSDEAFQCWCRWAKRSDKFDEEASRQKWHSFTAARDAGVTVGTIYFLARQNGWLGPQHAGELIAELNNVYAVVPVGGKVRILREEYDPVRKRQCFSLISQEDFKLLLSNRPAPEGPGKLGTYWLAHPARRQYKGIIFNPGATPEGYYNLYRGFSVQAAEGECTLFLQHILDVVCDGNDEHYEYVLNWLAHLVQKTGELPGVAIVLLGGQGVGKNTLVDTVGSFFGQHYLPLTNMNQVTGRFNSHLMDCIVVFANEAIWAGDRSVVGNLKAMITDAETAIEFKGKDIITARNYKRVLVASNENWPIAMDWDDRRFLILEVSDKHKGNQTYFAAIHDELDNGGREALLFLLQNRDIKHFNPRLKPNSKAGLDVKLRSAKPVEKWWFNCLQAGKVFRNFQRAPRIDLTDLDEQDPTRIRKDDVHNSYKDYCKEQGHHFPEELENFTKSLKRMLPSLDSARPTIGGERVRCYSFPSLAQCRKEFAVFSKEEIDWAEGD
ncbi:DUF5906 domain-containing protein [Gammaproteobacteria bacterium]|nr:DUF5906 domain-containing protein [Gammaproteobacteria bacterium]